MAICVWAYVRRRKTGDVPYGIKFEYWKAYKNQDLVIYQTLGGSHGVHSDYIALVL